VSAHKLTVQLAISIRSEYLDGATSAELAETYDINHSTVCRLISGRTWAVAAVLGPRRVMTTNERFWSKVDRTGGPRACWPWSGGVDEDGYGKFQVPLPGGGQRHVRAHRFALDPTNGPRPELVLHSCDNPPCCNPTHLSWDDQLANRQDCAAKGRTARGLQNGNGKLSDTELTSIASEYVRGVPSGEIARRHGITRSTAWAIGTGKYARSAAGERP
jgi:hypothetical protein